MKSAQKQTLLTTANKKTTTQTVSAMTTETITSIQIPENNNKTHNNVNTTDDIDMPNPNGGVNTRTFDTHKSPNNHLHILDPTYIAPTTIPQCCQTQHTNLKTEELYLRAKASRITNDNQTLVQDAKFYSILGTNTNNSRQSTPTTDRCNEHQPPSQQSQR